MNDRFLRACRRQPVDATPVWFMRQAGRSLPEYRHIRKTASLAEIVGDAQLCAEVTLQPVRTLGVDAAILFADITTPLAGMGVRVELVEGIGPVIDRPIRTSGDVRALRTFEPSTAVGPLLEAIGLLRRELDVPLIGFAGAPFTLATYLVEGRSSPAASRLRTMLYADPATAAALLDRLTDMTIAYLRAQVAAGAQALQIFDSWIGTLGPRGYQRFVASHMRRLFASLADLGVPIIHFGTGNPALIPSLAEAGGDVIGVDWRVPLADAWSQVPDRAVQGNLDPVAVLGPWDVAAAEARAVLQQADGRPGHIFNLGHGVLPETDPALLRGLVDLVHETTTRVGAAAGAAS
jgi:uroporphyrinogen decarboxylase